MGAEASPDITGLIGQYAHGNEPSHHILYMYNYVGQPWKAADKIRYVLKNLYHDDFDGLVVTRMWVRCLHGTFFPLLACIR